MKSISDGMRDALFGYLYILLDEESWPLECHAFGCSGDLSLVDDWLARHIGFGYARVLDEIRAMGCLCDCEVVARLPMPHSWEGTSESWEDCLRARFNEERERRFAAHREWVRKIEQATKIEAEDK